MVTLNKTTFNKKTAGTTAMVALLMIAGVFFGPAASAETREIKVRFVYNPHHTAEQIYTGFERTARKACGGFNVRPIEMRRSQARCTHEALDLVVARLNRADVAQIHSGKSAMVASR